jgi:two-component system sensor histidine kinase BaeS
MSPRLLRTLKISIGLRLFVSVLLAILAVAASAVYLLRQNVLESFGDYAVQIELDRLEELSNDLARRYALHGDWRFVPATGQRDWIARELARLQAERTARAFVVPPAPAAPAMVAPAVPAAPMAAPAPPAPPLPPLPPPALRAAPDATDAADAPDAASLPDADDAAPLQSRITLFDAGGKVLAGRPPAGASPDALPLARRAIVVDGRTVGTLAVARTARPTDALAYAFLQQLGASLWLIAGSGVLLSALVAVVLAAHFRRPIGRLAQGARALADGRFETRLPEARSDELGELAGHFNVLAARLQGAEEARRQWVADTSHELRTPLAVLRAQLEALQDGVRTADPAHVAAMLRQVLALSKLIDELYALARADVGALDCRRLPLDLGQLAREEAQAFAERFDAAGLTLEIAAAPPASVLADPDRMRQVLRNLFENSLRYTSAPGRVALSAQAAGGRFELSVDDSAPGVPAAALARLGERFFRVDVSRSRAGGGAGLGLALCRRLVEAQGGQLQCSHSPLGGLRVTLSMEPAP